MHSWPTWPCFLGSMFFRGVYSWIFPPPLGGGNLSRPNRGGEGNQEEGEGKEGKKKKGVKKKKKRERKKKGKKKNKKFVPIVDESC